MRFFVLLSVVLTSLGCESDDGTEPSDLPDPVCISEAGTPAPDFVGLAEPQARDLATERGLRVREVGRDGECLAVTMDLRQDRVNLEFVDEVVVGAAIY